MSMPGIQSVNTLLKHHSDNPTLQELRIDLENAQHTELSSAKLDKIIDIYRKALPIIEKTLWTSEIDDALVSQFQNSFQELEQFISLKGKDNRHSFVIVIPVADRPRHLSKCLESLLKLCQCYQYGGFSSQQYCKVSVIVADDSANRKNIQQHREIASRFSKLGLRTEYFGLEQQLEIIEQLSPKHRNDLAGVIGDFTTSNDITDFGHKGASRMRNITYLKLNQTINDINKNKTLIYFIDSDQEFCVNVPVRGGSKNVYAINYFHHLDEIFTKNDVSMLTGKVVGDPPVSPAVMAGTFQDDIIKFLREIATTEPEHTCSFHQETTTNEDAAYHDMANLFGFDHSQSTFRYNCTLDEQHDTQDCMHDFATKLSHFFHGEHPTRPTYFNYKSALSSTSPARTIYTGNYVFKPENLKFFISFAGLKLRMAGPTLGRIIQSELGNSFVSANLPMLHTRTVENTGQSEFRPGILASDSYIDFSDEFVRQYFGDVMLFTIEKLMENDCPAMTHSSERVRMAIKETEQKLQTQYQSKQQIVMKKNHELKTLFNEKKQWWNQSEKYRPIAHLFNRFIENIEKNFSDTSPGYTLILDKEYKFSMLEEIHQAILNYSNERELWQQIIK